MSSVNSRQSEIEAILRQQGTVHVQDLATRLHASLDTIRRDLRQMENAGHLRRIHGGAVLPSTSSTGSFQERSQELLPERAEIACKVAHEMIPDQGVVFFDSGSTVLEIARHLKPSFCGTAVTVNLAVAIELANHPNANVIVIGGAMVKRDLVTTGPGAIDEIRQYHADLCLIGTCALHPDHGMSTATYEERGTKSAMIEQSSETIAVATADKLETIMSFHVCDLPEIDRLVTGRKLSGGYLENYRKQGVEVVVA